MAPIVRVVTAACFAALCSVRTAFAQVKAVAAGEGAYTAINLARRGKMTVLIPMVTQTSSIVDDVVGGLVAIAGEECASITAGLNPVEVNGFWVGFQGESPNYAALVQGALKTGIAGINSKYPEEAWGAGEWSTSAVVANIGFLLNSQSTQVGCGITQNCPTNALLCRFHPAPQQGQQPFSKEYYAALIARTTSLEDMSSSDVNPDGSGATASVPSILLASFAGLMAFASI